MAMTRSTFAGFTTAQLALAASQRALDVTGQNLSNVNTKGYTRQRLDLASISPTGASYFMAQTDCRVGQGVEMTGVIQIRDPFLDIQYRNQLAKVGTVDAQDSILKQIGEIFDEVDATAVRERLTAVISALDEMSQPNNANQGASDSLVRSSFETLINVIHEHASALATVRKDAIAEMESTDIPNINQYLDSIVELNKSIKSAQILGGAALELQDQRNSLIDELATYFPIDVEYEDLNLGGGIKVDTLKITLKGANGQRYVLLNDAEHGEVSFKVNDATGKASVEVAHLGGKKANGGDLPKGTMDVTNNLANGVLKGNLDALNKSGGFDDPPSDFNGIGYYEKLFDSVVNTFANELNRLNQEAGGGLLFETIDGGVTTYASTGGSGSGSGSIAGGGGTTPGDSGYTELLFTALNIKVSDDWANGTTKIITDVKVGADGKPEDPDTTANVNVLKMIDALNAKELEFKWAGAGNPNYVAFRGTVFGAYDQIQNVQSIDRKATDAVLANRTSVLNEIADNKDSVSGVYMDEEVMSLMRYQQSYNAAARLMTTLDEALNTLINNTGVVGR